MRNYPILSVAYFCSTLISNAAHTGEVGDLITRSEESGATAANEASEMIDTFRSNGLRESESAARMVDSLHKKDVNRPEGSANQKTGSGKDIPLYHEGKGKCKDKASESSGKCPSSLFESMEAKQATNSLANTQLLIFVSQSVPANSIKELWSQSERVGGKLVFRGLVGGSFKETRSYIEELGIVADIDPTKFEEFEITQVPAFVLSREDMYDKMAGNISLNEFLEQSSTSGDLKQEAAELYKNLQGEQR